MHPDCHKVPWKKQLRHHTDQGAPCKCALTATKCQACRTKQPQRDTDQGAPPQPVKCQCHQVPHLPRKSTGPMSRSATHVRQSTTELWQSRVCVLRSCVWHCVTKLRLTMLRVCVWHICIDVKLLLFKYIYINICGGSPGSRGGSVTNEDTSLVPGTRVNVPAGLWWRTWAYLRRSWWSP